MSEQKLPSVEEKKSLRELRAEKAQQIRKKDLALWAHSGAKHQDFVKKLQIGLANVEENILSDINLNTTIFSCDFYFSFDYDQILHSNHAEGFILPEYLFRQLLHIKGVDLYHILNLHQFANMGSVTLFKHLIKHKNKSLWRFI
jgi:hypothetical protein